MQLQQENERKDKAINLVENIKKIQIKFTKEADEKDQLYGAVSKKEIINFLSEKDIILLSDDIKIPNAIGKSQKLRLFNLGRAISGAPICIGNIQLARPTNAGIITPKTIIRPWFVVI